MHSKFGVKNSKEKEEETREIFNKVKDFLQNLQIEDYFKIELPSENEINKKFKAILDNYFENVEFNETLTGRSHIDITVGSTIAIEVKKIESNTPKDEVVGQLVEDLRIGNYAFGIALGIDQTKNNNYIGYNDLYNSKLNIHYIIKANPFKYKDKKHINT